MRRTWRIWKLVAHNMRTSSFDRWARPQALRKGAEATPSVPSPSVERV